MAKVKAAKTPAAENLLVEILTEELPPKSLAQLGQALAGEILDGLIRHQLKFRDPVGLRMFATPRRLAVLVPEVLARGEDRSTEIGGPPVGAAPEAVAGFAKKHKLSVAELDQRYTDKGRVFVARFTVKGVSLAAVLGDIVNEAAKKLPVRKAMRWGSGETQFVRPVHGLVMMHGKRVVSGTVLGAAAGNRTSGHRFMGAESVRLGSAQEYEASLRKNSVVVDLAVRRDEIDKQLLAEARRRGASLGEYRDLLDE